MIQCLFLLCITIRALATDVFMLYSVLFGVWYCVCFVLFRIVITSLETENCYTRVSYIYLYSACVSVYYNDPTFSDTQIWANSVNPDQTACLPFRVFWTHYSIVKRHNSNFRLITVFFRASEFRGFLWYMFFLSVLWVGCILWLWCFLDFSYSGRIIS